MTLESRLEQLMKGWRGIAAAAFVAFLAGLPGLLAMPPLDRDESRFAQATSQMLETGDYVSIKLQEKTRDKKPVGIHWLQAIAVSLTGDVEDRNIWPYRLPSLLGAMLAAAACVWGARRFMSERLSFVAGTMLAASFLLSTEAFIAKTDAVLAGATTLAMAALARLYAEHKGLGPAQKRTRLLLWVGIALGVMVKGPVILMVFGLALIALAVWDRDNGWMKKIGWGWGLLLVIATFGPWALAITVATDGAFWGAAIGGDLAPKLAGGHERHGGLFGYHAALSPLLVFPATALLPAGLLLGWQARNEPGVRFALCWLIPTWLMFELLPTKLVHYSLPAHGALFWLMAMSLRTPLGNRVKIAGAVLAGLAATAFAGVAVYGYVTYGDAPDLAWTIITALLFLATGAAAIVFLYRYTTARALIAAGALGVLAHAALFGQLFPRLEPFWVAERIELALRRTGLDPRVGRTPGPVEVAGYSEASLVFTLGTRTGVGGPEEAVRALAQGRPAIVESREMPEFQSLLREQGFSPKAITTISGLNYSNGDEMALTLYQGLPRSAAPASQPATAGPVK